ncbi:hypothetical protein HN011_012040 [Eciton burchellii]|nr:hypothetical protein HN011_012040 [Eciton burchellii]
MMAKSSVLVFLKFVVLLIANISAQYQDSPAECMVNGQIGRCIDVHNCALVASILQQSHDEAIAYLKRNHCGFNGSAPLICCINQPFNDRQQGRLSERKPQPNVQSNELANNPLLPTSCGRDLLQRIVGGSRMAPDEFSWMVLVEYQKPNGRTTACGGVLISHRYVLTAAHCLKGKDLPQNWRLSSVRLGEYDTDTDRDCLSDGNGGETCTDDPITVGVEEQIAHEQYQPQSREQRYDIALLRLSHNVTFSKYIKPICLPSSSTSLQGMLQVAGWGKTESRSSSNVKLKLSLPLVDQDQCNQVYGNVSVQLGYGQICAGGQRGKDSCRGDSGGPLMTVEALPDGSGRWSVVGVVSFGPSPCGMPGWPGVYTKVQDFVPWILSKLRV